jgi:hypothetical protein
MGEWRYSYTIFDLCARWEWSVSCSGCFTAIQWTLSTHFYRRLGGPQRQSGRCGVGKNLLPLLRIKPLPSRLLLHRLSYPGFYQSMYGAAI